MPKLGPAIVSASLFPDAAKFTIRGVKNGNVLQDCPLTYVHSVHRTTAPSVLANDSRSDLIFSVPKLVSFLSQGTTLPAGTVILTGTPPGVGAARNPKEFLRAGDEFAVELLPHVGTLVTKVVEQ